MLIDTFLTTFQSFTTPAKFFEKLVQRFDVPQSDMPEAAVKVIQLQVVNVLKKWMNGYPADFDDALRVRVKQFSGYVATVSENLADAVAAAYKRLVDNTGQRTLYRPVDPPEPVLPADFLACKWSLLSISHVELARQITVCDWMIFKKIQPRELLNQSWSKPKLKYRSPNVLAMIRRFNVISNWVTSSILSRDCVRDRALVMERFVRIGEELLRLNNYNSLMSILGGLNASSVSRLKFTTEEMDQSCQRQRTVLEQAMSSDNNFRDYRARVNDTPQGVPVLPYLGVYLTDLTFVDENSDFVDGLVNFSKRMLIFNIIHQISVRQNSPYNIQPVQQIIERLSRIQILDDKEFFQRSLRLEPRGASRANIK